MEEAVLEKIELKSHESITHHYGYEIKELQEDFATITVDSERFQRVKESGYIFEGELINGALIASAISVNDHQFSLIKIQTDLLQPIKEEGEIVFHSQIEIDGGIKKVIKCYGSINEIKFLEAELSFVKMIS